MEQFLKKEYFIALYDVYKGLLTKKQREVFELYFFDDNSTNEIAELLGITRSAAFDTINKATKQLQAFEESIGYIDYHNSVNKKIDEYLKDKDIKVLEEIKEL